MPTNKFENVNVEEIQLKLYEKLRASGWGDRLKSFMFSSEFLDILKELLDQARQGRRFTPVIKQLFRAFEECPYGKLKVIMLGQD